MKTNILYTTAFAILLLCSCSEKNEKCSHNHQANNTNTKNDCEHLVMSTLWYQQSAEMQACYLQAYNWAKIMLEKNLDEKTTDLPAAVVMDLDETVLDNSPFQAKSIETGIGYSPETWQEWTNNPLAEALPGALEFVKFANEKSVEVFYISNRLTTELETTMENMKNLGFPNIESSYFFLKEETSGKKERRAAVSKTHDIILFIGDVLTDFSEIYEKRDGNLAKDIVEKDKDLFGTKYIILPNPMYGEWEKAVYNNSFNHSEMQKDSLRKAALKSY